MTDREKFILRMALIYLQTNWDEAFETFVDDKYYDQPFESRREDVSVNGDEGLMPTSEEISNLITCLQ